MAKRTTNRTTTPTTRTYTRRTTPTGRRSYTAANTETVTVTIPKQLAFSLGVLVGQAQAAQQ